MIQHSSNSPPTPPPTAAAITTTFDDFSAAVDEGGGSSKGHQLVPHLLRLQRRRRVDGVPSSRGTRHARRLWQTVRQRRSDSTAGHMLWHGGHAADALDTMLAG